MINIDQLNNTCDEYHNSKPFSHCVINEFLDKNIIKQIDNDFLPYDHPVWIEYTNSNQIKKMYNDWYYFPKSIYNLFYYLNSQQFVDQLGQLIGTKLYTDPGLYSGGCHLHGPGGILAPHLDYNVHPKLPYQRKINLIIYCSENYLDEYGGHLELWEGTDTPTRIAKKISPQFNRAVIFDTTQNSWHGVSKFDSPVGTYRKSLAVYYLTEIETNKTVRNNSLFL